MSKENIWREPPTVPGPEQVLHDSQPLFSSPCPFPTNTSARGQISGIGISQVLTGVRRGAEGHPMLLLP